MRYAILTVAVFTSILAVLYTQTAETLDVEKTDAAPAANESAITLADEAAVEVEMQRRFNEFRSRYLDDRADSINWWLTVIAVVLAFFGVVVAIAGFIGFRRFQAIETEARNSATEARKHVDEIRSHKTQAQKAVDDIRSITAQDVADPAKAKQVEKVVETVRQAPDASLIDKATAMVYSLQKAGKTEEAIKKLRSIADLMDGIDDEIAAGAWFSIGYLLSEENPKEAISAYDQSIRLDPSESATYSNRGIAKIALDQYQEAMDDFDRAIHLNPSNAVAYYNRGGIKVELGRINESRHDFLFALRFAQEHGNTELVTDITKILQKIDNSKAK